MDYTYKIVRFYKNSSKKKRTIKTELSLQEAQEHCNREDTRGEDWFDGYEKQEL